MRTGAIVAIIAGMGCALIACGNNNAEREAKLAAMSAQEREIQKVLDQKCVKCHTAPDAKGNLDLTEPKNLLPLISSTQLFDDIALYNMLMGDSTIAEHAPKEFQLQQSEVDMIRRWVLSEHSDLVPDSVRAQQQGT
ncbi:MAG TPA: hypothetical protein PK251_05475 [Candidatus Latescibacteria bacterium]|jgi:mono/diheme cytochrome c family protein|nr:hypothetical protein [Candidatus Latescibacterota bacterium]HOS64193.1 hypothetical protein [Candidatus Latescibacterota bacterium]HPC45173.1 hypothetical protein [Candidatus Latescibacterota bacterium]HPK74806.1 hypothetical protein [Candidatus Latescibacterota bacterium]HRU23774.1 hypothetical protein [Candidatus Latescibacterota bacterium]